MNPNPPNNALLAALPAPERARIEQRCERVALLQGQALGTPGAEINRVYFPTDSLIALMVDGGKHDALAVGLIGNEGMLGASLVLGGRSSPLRAMVQSSGGAWSMETEALRRILADTPLLERELRLYLHAVVAQFAQIAVCAAFHVVVNRLAYWLLTTHDRVQGDRFYLTHDLLSRLLGVRRSGVTAAAGILQRQHLIAYTRGRVLILDRRGLEQQACVCYRAAREAFTPLAQLAVPRDEGYGEPAGGRLLRLVRGIEPRRRVVREPARRAGVRH